MVLGRKIGISGIECFDGPCNPWSKAVCSSCAIRPMKVYTGNDGSLRTITLARKYGWGVFHTAKYEASAYGYHALDNGAYSAWANGKVWDATPFLSVLKRYDRDGPRLDFVVIPDIVAGGLRSLKHSLKWLNTLETTTRKYLAVQDGMSLRDIKPIIHRFGGLFVGGTIEWKYRTAKVWIELAHEAHLPCHIGRVGTWDRLRWASMIGADSVDSTSWARSNSYHHIERANSTTGLELFQEGEAIG